MRERDGADPVKGPRATSVSLERRRLCQWLLVPAAQLAVPWTWAATAKIASARLWPAQEYTRVIVESPLPIAHEVITLRDPNRVILELKAAELTSDLAQLPMRVQETDPYIAAIRFGTRPPDVLRIVFELKTE